jgi:hypothetical protein
VTRAGDLTRSIDGPTELTVAGQCRIYTGFAAFGLYSIVIGLYAGPRETSSWRVSR